MFSQIKIYIYIVLFVVLASAIGGAIWYYKWSQNEITVLHENNAKLQVALQSSEEAVKSLQKDGEKLKSNLTEVNKKFDDARRESDLLKEKLSKHELAYLAAMKSKLVEKAINNGTEEAGRCFEIINGSPLTQQESSATKPSEINKTCPDLANPHYKAQK